METVVKESGCEKCIFEISEKMFCIPLPGAEKIYLNGVNSCYATYAYQKFMSCYQEDLRENSLSSGTTESLRKLVVIQASTAKKVNLNLWAFLFLFLILHLWFIIVVVILTR